MAEISALAKDALEKLLAENDLLRAQIQKLQQQIRNSTQQPELLFFKIEERPIIRRPPNDDCKNQ